jgi:hypothetical protein
MDSDRRTAWLWSGRRTADGGRGRLAPRATVLAVTCAFALGVPARSTAQGLSAAEREALIQLYADRGGPADDIDALLGPVDEAGTKGLPVTPLTSKIREGLAKGVPPARIIPVVRQLVTHLESADILVREVQPDSDPIGREGAVTLLAESIGGGVTPEEVRAIVRQAEQDGGVQLSPEALASAAKSLSFIKEASLSADDGTTVVVEAARRGYRNEEMLDLGREVKRRERDFHDGRATLRELRDAIARGDRVDQLFRTRPDEVPRPPATRPETPVRPEAPERPQPVERPQRPERPQTPQRP